MRINMDCVRDILLCVEKNTGLHQSCYFIDEKQMEAVCYATGEDMPPVPEYQKRLPQENEVLLYHVLYCAEAGLIKQRPSTETYRVEIADLTVKGHDFLSNIRDPKGWTAIKKIGAYSLNVMIEAAKAYVLGKLT